VRGWRERLSRLWGPADPGPEAASCRFSVLDTELTGLDPRRDDIVSLGAVRMEGGRILVGGAWNTLVKPRAELGGASVLVHRITPGRLEKAPPFDDVLPAFRAWTEGTVLAGHCINVDLGFLDREARRLGLAPFDHPAVDTLSLYGWLRQRLPAHPAFRAPIQEVDLTALARALGVAVERAHTALGDAYVTAQVLQRFLPLLAGAGVTSLSGLLRAGDPRRQMQNLASAEGGVAF